jgi:hypothetical protein
MPRRAPPANVHAMATAEQIRVDARTAKFLTRLALAELARWSLETAGVRHRHHAARRNRALMVGAVALGFAVAGLAVRRARQKGASLPEVAPPVT